MKLYRYQQSFGRMGDLSGLFAVNEEGETILQALLKTKCSINLGEVLGKHSEVELRPWESKTLSQVTATGEEIATVFRVLGVHFEGPTSTLIGTNPMETWLEMAEPESFEWDNAIEYRENLQKKQAFAIAELLAEASQ